MSTKMKLILENIKEMTADEKAFVAHCLISSLEEKQDEDVDNAWAEVVEKRFSELKSGAVNGITWEDIKKNIKG